MKAGMLHGNGHDQAGHEHHVGAGQVVPGNLVRVCHAGQWQYDQWQEGGDGQGQTLKDPEDCHDQDGVQGPHCLMERVIRSQRDGDQDHWGHYGQY